MIMKGKNMDSIILNCDRLIYCRKKLGITKQEAARRMLLSQPAYLRYESGERTPSIHVIYFMANVLGTSADFLLGKTDNPNPDSYFIRAAAEPNLFSLIETYKSATSDTQKRLTTYLLKLSAAEHS